jgi:hypothetical protein
MVTVKIGASERTFENVEGVEEGWVNQQIKGLRGDGHPVCIFVTLNEGPVSIFLSTPDCQKLPGGSRPLTPEEERAFDLWDKLGLNRPDFQGHSLIAFFKQVRRIIG